MAERSPADKRLEDFLNAKSIAWLRSREHGGKERVLFGCFCPDMDIDGPFLTISTNRDGTLRLLKHGLGGYKRDSYWNHHWAKATFRDAEMGILWACLRSMGYSI
jgi:hypothetical protein